MTAFKDFSTFKEDMDMMEVTKILTETVKALKIDLEKAQNHSNSLTKKLEEANTAIFKVSKQKKVVVENLEILTIDKRVKSDTKEKLTFLIQVLKDEVENISELPTNHDEFESSVYDGLGPETSFLTIRSNLQPLNLDETQMGFEASRMIERAPPQPVIRLNVTELKTEMKKVKSILKNYLEKFEEYEDKERFEEMKKTRVFAGSKPSDQTNSEGTSEASSTQLNTDRMRRVSHMGGIGGLGVPKRSGLGSRDSSRNKPKPNFLKRSVHNSSSLTWILQSVYSNSVISRASRNSKPGSSQKGGRGPRS